ncbi:MAG TPA: hypothetical protein VHB77_06450 [Planctomycetaceae bacterium]|nr:hypothetical protein [Planctomycetaceae bacterium]
MPIARGWFTSLVLCGLLLGLNSLAVGQEKKGESDDKPTATKAVKDRATLEKELQETLSGSALVGHFSVDGQNSGKPPAEERYTITKAQKLKDDYWLLMTRIQYGGKDLTLPLTLKIVWADDTPMITLTDLTIPGLGTFTSRVMIYRGRYAGTWQHGEVGGHLWGRVEKLPAEDKAAPTKKPEKAE